MLEIEVHYALCYGSTQTVSQVLEFEGFYPVGNVPVTPKKVVCSQFDCGVVVNKSGFPL
jgi:hypothetical protein